MHTSNISLNEKTIWSYSDLMAAGFSRSMAYELLNREDMPVVKIGSRRFMNAELFREWLREQATGKA